MLHLMRSEGQFCVLHLCQIVNCCDTVHLEQEEVGALTTRLGSDCQAIVRCLATNLNVAVRNGMQCIGARCFCTWLPLWKPSSLVHRLLQVFRCRPAKAVETSPSMIAVCG